MAKQTWNVDRQKGGSYEFSLDASGNYVLNSVGFNQVKTLNLPELKKETTAAATTTTPKDTKTASAQTKEAFGDVQPFYYGSNRGADTQYTTKYEMTKDKSLDTTQPMTTGDGPWTMRSGKAPIDDNKSWENVAKSYTLAGQKVPERFEGESDIYKNMSAADAALLPGQSQESVKQPDRFGTGQWGPKPSKGMPVDTRYRSESEKFKTRFDPTKIKAAPQKAKVSETALKAVKTTSNVLSKAFNTTFKTPMMMLVDAVAGPPTATQTHAKGYFNVREDGRISGNAATDLYAGMNRVSKFGNLEKAGAKRIATREKTIAKYSGKWSQEKMNKFKETTNNMKDQQNTYTRDKHKDVAKDAVKKGADPMNPSEMRAASIKASNEKGNSGNGGGNGGGRVICTELHSTGEMSTRDWIRDIRFTYKDLSKEHIKGYLLWAVPTVEHIKKYPTYRKIWKHLAQHRANDIAWRLNQGKFDLLGRIYAGIGEPLCWLIGKCVSDKQIKELELSNWRKA